MNKQVNTWLYSIFFLLFSSSVSLLTSTLSCCFVYNFEIHLNSKGQGKGLLGFQLAMNNNNSLSILNLETLSLRCRRKSRVEYDFRFAAKQTCLFFISEFHRLVNLLILTDGRPHLSPGKGQAQPSQFLLTCSLFRYITPFLQGNSESQKRDQHSLVYFSSLHMEIKVYRRVENLS